MDFLFHFSFPLISSVIAISILFLFFYYAKKARYDYGNSISVIELLGSLSKICPLCSLNKWKLLPFNSGSVRCWHQDFTLPATNIRINVYGSSIIIESSSANIGSLIADMTKWADWNPCSASQLIVKSFHDKKLKRDHYMEAEQIISIVRKANTIQSHVAMYRFHVYSDNKAGCILFWNAKKLEFMFFLIQPIKNNSECTHCVLTHITGTESDRSEMSASIISQRLHNIQDLMSHLSLNPVPFQLTPQESKSIKSSVDGGRHSASQENFFSLSSSRARKRDIRNTVFILVPFISSTCWYFKEKREFKLGVKNMDRAESSVKPENQSFNLKNTSSKYPMRRAMSDVGTKPTLRGPAQSFKLLTIENKKEGNKLDNAGSGPNDKPVLNSKHESGTTSEDSETKSNPKSKHKLKVKNFLPRVKLRSFSETALDRCEAVPEYKVSEYDGDNNKRLKDIDEKPEDKVLAMHDQDHRDIFNSSVSDFEVVESKEALGESGEFAENRIASLMTHGNYGAAELQAEVLLASEFEQCLNSGNFQSCGGWMLHSHYKGLTVLGKTTSNHFLQITSFLCQTELPVNLKDLWKFVKCPQFRFICDETVKSVEVLEKLSSSQKIIRTYHEVGGLLRKELVDFCLLQTERVELNKCYSCFYSIENDKCPFMNLVTRGTLRPSGWIVEEVENKNTKRSKVTYMIQMISDPDSLLLQELSTLVPQSVHNLKNYITAKPV